MFKANKFLAIIVLFFFVVIMGSCGGGGGGGGSSGGETPPQASDEYVGGDGTTEINEDDIQVIFGTGDQTFKSSKYLQAQAQISGVPYLSQLFPQCDSITYTANCGPTSFAMVKGFYKKTTPTELDIKDFLQYYWTKLNPNLDVLMEAVKQTFTNFYDKKDVDFKKRVSLEAYLKPHLDYFRYTDPNTKEVKINEERLKYCGVHLNNNNYIGAHVDQIKEQAEKEFSAKQFVLQKDIYKQHAENILWLATEWGYPVIAVSRFYKDCDPKNTDVMEAKYGHYLVVVGIDNDYVYVNDPVCAGHINKRYTKKSFLDVWGTNDQNAYKGVLIAPKGKELPVGIVKQSLPTAPAKVGEPYNVQLAAVYGTDLSLTNYKWSYIGTLPEGLKLDEDTGMLHGVPTKEGDYSFTVRVSAGVVSFADAPISITVSLGAVTPPLRITTPPNLGTAKVGEFYNMQLSASGGKFPYTWSRINGRLPNGIELTGDKLAGRPNEYGEDFQFTLQVTDANQKTERLTFHLKVLPLNNDPRIDRLIADNLEVKAGNTTTVTCYASDPDNDQLVYSWLASNGSFSGSVSGPTVTWIAPSTTGTYTVTCSVSDSKGGSASKSVNITVTESTTPLSITTTSLPSGTVGVSYPATNLSATGGKPPYNWSWSGNTPLGLSLSTSGVISGTPTTAGTYNFTVKVTDGSSPQRTDTKALSITVNPAGGYSISGRVTLNGSGLSGVTITLTGTGSTTTTTDSNGNYTFTGAQNGSYTITPSKSGYTFSPSSIPVTVNNANVTGQNFTAPSTLTYSISGRVTLNGSGLSGVTITLTGTGSTTTTTDSNGNYTFTGAQNGSYTITPSKSGYTFTPSSRSIAVNNANLTGQDFTATQTTQTFTLTVTKSGTGSGTVTSSPAGINCGTTCSASFNQGTTVTLTPSPASGSTFAGWSGACTGTGTCTLTIDANKSVTATFTSGGYSISGRVTLNGSGLSGVTITLTGTGSTTTTTDSNGNYTFTGAQNGSYTITPSKTGYTFTPSSRSVTVNNANETGIDFTASSTLTYSISGRVTLNGSGLSGVTITLMGTGSTTATTGSDGSYIFTGAQNGFYTITPSKSGYTFNPPSRSITVNNADITGQDFTASSSLTYSISGRVTLNGSGLSGVTITLTGTGSTSTTTDSNGNYSFTGAQNGSYTITPSKSGYTFSPSSIPVTVNNANVTGQNFTATQTTGGILSVSPTDRFDSSGTQGGPFTPSSKTYTLSNTGGSSINWTASKGQSWVSLSSTSGTLLPSGSTTVTVSINSNANSLSPSNYVDTVSFTNTTNGNGNTTRTVNLTVNYSTPTITVGPSSLNFGSVNVGTCETAVFVIQHVSGTGPASGTVSASPNPPFSITSGSSFSVSNGAAANVTVQFCPTSSGTFNGTATVSSSATFTGTNTITLTGTGFSSCTPPGSFTLSANAYCNTTPPAAPAVMLTWTASSGASYYDVYRNGTLYYSGVTGTSFDNNANVVAGQTYTYYVVARNSCGNTQSNTVPVTVPSNICPSIQVERITNGSFSSGPSGWTLMYDFWAGTDGSYPRTSPGYAAGGVNSSGYPKDNATGWMYQTVTIPANATSATLSFWYYITTQEAGSIGNDFLNVTIQNSSGNYLATIAFLLNLNKGTGYSQITFNMLPYKGQIIRINFLATTNSSLNTVFRIDDVSLMSDGN